MFKVSEPSKTVVIIIVFRFQKIRQTILKILYIYYLRKKVTFRA